ncbi:MAG: lipid-A-disaccharide synthase [Gemmatimonadota bacterium]
MSAEPTIFLSAGEASGEQHGAELARALRRRIPGVRIVGLGGSEMAEAGVELIAGLDRLAILGFAEVIRHLPDILRLRRDVRDFVVREHIDLLVPIDYPGFNLPLADWTHRRGIPVVYYIAPQVWAWHESRARRLARIADEVCVVLPFERGFLEPYGTKVRFVGHPLLDRKASAAVAGRPSGDVRSGAPVLGLFPGSRPQEVRRMLPVFLDAAARLRSSIPGLGVRVARSADLPGDLFDSCPAGSVSTPEIVASEATAAITKSGTITLQLALADVPMVVGYRVNNLTATIARRLIRVSHIALVNLVADRGVVPERIQGEMTGAELAQAAAPLLDFDSEERKSVLKGLAEVRSLLGDPGAADRVAESCVRAMRGPGGQ